MNVWVCKCRIKWVVVAILAGLVLLVVAVYSTGTVPASPPLPNPNGYTDFVQAGEAIQGSPGDSPTLDQAGLRALTSTNAEPLRQLRLGLTRQCYLPMDSNFTNAGMAQLALMKRSAQLLAAEGRLREMENHPGEAARSYAEAIRFGNELSRGGPLITRLVGIACEAIGYASLSKLVPQLSPGDARTLAAELESVDGSRITWPEVLRNEQHYCHLQKMTPARHPVLWAMSWWQSRAAFARAELKHQTVVAHERLLIAELALRGFRAEQGQAPDRLDELTNHYVARVPLDPFAMQPLLYRAQGTNWLLYSVGADGVDDGGKRAGKGVSAKGDLFYDSP